MAATTTQDPPHYLVYSDQISVSPPGSPQSSPENTPVTASSSSSSVDQLPPAMSEEATTPAPSEDHPHMDSHSSEIILEDEHAYHDLQHEPHLPFAAFSRPTSPVLPPTTATTLIVNPHPLSQSFAPIPAYEDLPPRSSTPASGSSTPTRTPSRGHRRSQSHGHSLPHHGMSSSPFSFFANSALSHGEYPHTAPSAKTLRIELAQPEMILVAGRTTILEGVLHLNLLKNTKVKSLQLEFSGRSSVTWVDDNAYSPATRHTTAPHIEHTWPIISHQHKQPPTILPAGQHKYPFSLELLDTLPETLTTTHGKVAYRLTATLTKPGLGFNSSSTTAPVIVMRRHPSPVQGSRGYQRGGRLVNSEQDKVKYKITLPQIRVPHSTKVPLQVSITTPNDRISVNVLQVGLWERVVYRADGRKRVDMRLVKIQKSEGWPQGDRPGHGPNETLTWNKVLLFDMPPMGTEMNQCNPSADNGLMKVSHLLRFSILGTDNSKRFRVENETEIKVLAFEDEYEAEEMVGGEQDPLNELPSYLTSFSTPRVSFDSERDLDPAQDDLLRALVARIHLPTYDESEDDANSRDPSRNHSRAHSRTHSRAASRSTSPERSASTGSHHGPHHHEPSPLQHPVPAVTRLQGHSGSSSNLYHPRSPLRGAVV